MADLTAIAPGGGEVIHLHDPDYRPARKPRAIQRTAALCGCAISPPGVPLADAIGWTDRAPTAEDPRPRWRWCRNCLGHLVDRAGLVDVVLQHPAVAGA